MEQHHITMTPSHEGEEQHHARDFVPVKAGNKREKYENVRREFRERLDSNAHPLSNTSNLIAILMQEFGWWWIGFYWVKYKGTVY